MVEALRPAVFLDRDGVLIRSHIREGKPYAIGAGDAVEVLDGVQEACKMLSWVGFVLVMVTNQPDVARGATPRSFVEDTNAALAARLGLDDVRACFHDSGDKCDCRKPKPGMLLSAARELCLDLSRSVMVGDRWRDVVAGRNAGVKTVLLDYGYDETRASAPDHVAVSLLGATDWILGRG